MLWQTGIPECLGGVQQPGGLVVSQSFVFSLDFPIFPMPRDLRLEVVDVNVPMGGRFGGTPNLFLLSFLRFSDFMFLSLALVSVKQSQNNGSDGASQNIIDYVPISSFYTNTTDIYI